MLLSIIFFETPNGWFRHLLLTSYTHSGIYIFFSLIPITSRLCISTPYLFFSSTLFFRIPNDSIIPIKAYPLILILNHIPSPQLQITNQVSHTPRLSEGSVSLGWKDRFYFKDCIVGSTITPSFYPYPPIIIISSILIRYMVGTIQLLTGSASLPLRIALQWTIGKTNSFIPIMQL